MKKTLAIWLLAGIFYTKATAQVPYPVATDQGNIVRMEYFFNSDPGFGNGIAVPVTPGRTIANINLNVDVSALPQGWHRIYVRSMNENGGWSIPAIMLFDNLQIPSYPNLPAAASDIVEIEYYIDSDPGFGNGRKIALPASPDINKLPVQIDISGLPATIHTLVIRTKNRDNKWSMTHFSLFSNETITPYPTAPAAPAAITNMEYFFDTDPGFGNGQPISFTGTPDINGLSVDLDLPPTLSIGNHTLFIRSKEFPWSMTMAVNFNYAVALPVTWLYVRGERKQQQALLNWATAQESDADKFIVEYSRDGQQYIAAGEVTAAGNSTATTKYAFTYPDLQPGVNYFRLKQLDKNGHFTYSSIIVIPYVDNNTAPVLMPNPVTSAATLLIPPAIEAEQLIVFDASGKAVWQQQANSKNQSQLLQFGSLPKGIYILNIKGRKQHYNIRFVKN
jgi:hypothetical protein